MTPLRTNTSGRRRAATLLVTAGIAVVLALTTQWWLPALPTLFGVIEANREMIGAFADLTTIATFVMLVIGGVLGYLGYKNLQSANAYHPGHERPARCYITSTSPTAMRPLTPRNTGDEKTPF